MNQYLISYYYNFENICFLLTFLSTGPRLTNYEAGSILEIEFAPFVYVYPAQMRTRYRYFIILEVPMFQRLDYVTDIVKECG